MENRFSEPYSHPRWWWVGSHIPVCFGCEHFRGMVRGKLRCVVYPDGIPKELATKKEKQHGDPPSIDGCTRFEPADD